MYHYDKISPFFFLLFLSFLFLFSFFYFFFFICKNLGKPIDLNKTCVVIVNRSAKNKFAQLRKIGVDFLRLTFSEWHTQNFFDADPLCRHLLLKKRPNFT